ncbi:MAG TPA: type II secretion system F family protein [Gemmatimonadales bacterium]
MKRFRYRAARRDGALVRGVVTADHQAAALDRLSEQRLLPLALEELVRPRSVRAFPRADLAVLLRGLATLMAAGVPLERALAAMDTLPRLRGLVASLRRRLREGASLSRALRDEARVPPVVAGLIRAGERVHLGLGLEEAARQLEREAEFRGRLWAALTYPIVLLVAGSAAVAVLVVAILPRFVALLEDAGSALPASTRWLMTMSGLVREHGIVLGAAVLVLTLLGARGLQTASGHALLLGAPVVGRVRLALATARVSRTLGALLRVGAPALTALDAARDSAGDLAVAQRLTAAGERVRSGATLAAALGAEHALGTQALQLIGVGERAGKVGELLDRAADLAEADTARALNTLVTWVEPGLILMLGGLVTFVALALLQAVYGLRIG